MCFGSKTSTSVQTQEIPAWVQNAGQQNIDTAQQLANRPYPQYGGPRVAEFSPDETAAFDIVRGMSGSWKPNVNTAASALVDQAQGGRAPTEVANYMSPYIGEVVNRQISDVQRAGEVARRGIGARAHAAGAFGDSRHGIADAELDRNILESVGDVTAKGNQSAWEQAMQMFLGESQLQQGAANSLINAATAEQNLGLKDVGALMQTGAAQQGKDQTSLDLAYQDFLQQFYYPVEGLNMSIGALSGTPYSRTQTTTGPSSSAAAQTLGGIGALAGGAAKLGSLFF